MTTFEDRTLVCVDCNAEFQFTAGEQEFYAEKRLTSEPKRCKACRSARKKKQRGSGKGKGDGIYRSPAFERSAPAHQKIRGRHGQGPRRGDYRSPGLNERRPHDGEYRSPAFRDIDVLKPEEEYRAPGFREREEIDPTEEYRSPGFAEHADVNIREEYRAPGFQDMTRKYRDEKPLFSIVCSGCGQEAMIPYLPEGDEPVFCKPCYQVEREKRREAARAEREAAEKEAAEKAAAAEAAANTPSDAEVPAETEVTADAAPVEPVDKVPAAEEPESIE